MSEMMTNSQDFNRCVENDHYLSKCLNVKLGKIMNSIVASDIFLYEHDENVEPGQQPENMFKAYNDATGE